MKKFLLSLAAIPLLFLAAFAAASPVTDRWAVVGDDIFGSIFDYAYPVPSADRQWQAIVQRRVPVALPNLAAGAFGWVLRPGMMAAHLTAAESLGFRKIIVSAGSYDWQTNQSITAVQANATALLKPLVDRGIKVVCVTPLYRTDERTRKGPQSALGYTLNPVPSVPRFTYANAVANGCAQAGAEVIFGRNAPLNLSHLGDRAFTRLHLNAQGHAVFADWLLAQMQARGHWLLP